MTAEEIITVLCLALDSLRQKLPEGEKIEALLVPGMDVDLRVREKAEWPLVVEKDIVDMPGLILNRPNYRVRFRSRTVNGLAVQPLRPADVRIVRTETVDRLFDFTHDEK